MRALRREIDQEMSEAQTALEQAHARQTLQDQLNETLQVRLTGLEGIATELRALVAAREAKVMDLEALLKRRDEDLGSANARIRDLEALVKEAGGQVKEASAAMKARDLRLHAAEEELVCVRKEAAAKEEPERQGKKEEDNSGDNDDEGPREVVVLCSLRLHPGGRMDVKPGFSVDPTEPPPEEGGESLARWFQIGGGRY